MNFSVDFLYLCLFFPLWVCMLIFCNSALFSLKSRKAATAGTLSGCVFIMILTFLSCAKNFSYENNLLLFSINDIGIHFGLFINKLNSCLMFIASLFIAITTLVVFGKYKNENFFYKYLFLINLLLFLVTCFFASSNMLQMFICFSLIYTIFYIMENLTNSQHERAKNFLVLNKIGDFTLLIPICLLFYYDNFFSFDLNDVVLQLNDIKNTFFGIQSICETNIFVLICTLIVSAIFIKTILSFIHPLKLKSNTFLLTGICAATGLYWLYIIYPLFYYIGNLRLITGLIVVLFVFFAFSTLYLKNNNHDLIVKINSQSHNIFRDFYLKFANLIKNFDEKILNNLYEFFSNIVMKLSGCIKIAEGKNTLFALIFNIIGIVFLILTAWIIYLLVLKG